MKLDIVAQLVHILKEAPEIGAIEIRRGPFGVWSSVRVSKAGHGANAAGQVFVAQGAAAPLAASGHAPPPQGPAGEGGARGGAAAVPAARAQLPVVKTPLVGASFAAPRPGAAPDLMGGSRRGAAPVV